jgi:hypothetical protein
MKASSPHRIRRLLLLPPPRLDVGSRRVVPPVPVVSPSPLPSLRPGVLPRLFEHEESHPAERARYSWTSSTGGGASAA